MVLLLLGNLKSYFHIQKTLCRMLFYDFNGPFGAETISVYSLLSMSRCFSRLEDDNLVLFDVCNHYLAVQDYTNGP